VNIYIPQLCLQLYYVLSDEVYRLEIIVINRNRFIR
jgi:hypothetical protein